MNSVNMATVALTDPALLLGAVLLAHGWGDFLLQTDWQASSKSLPQRVCYQHLHSDGRVETVAQEVPGAADRATSWRAMAAHLLTYHLALAVPVVAAWGCSGRTAAFLVISVVTHAVIDRRWPVLRLMTATGSARFAATERGRMITDQVLHVTVLTVALVALTPLALPPTPGAG